MNKKDQQSLRKRAEALYRKVDAVGNASDKALLHELEVHQIELEIQNEDLRTAQQHLESTLERYEDLFNHAPVGYLNLKSDGSILNANFAVAEILGATRSELINSKIHRYIVSDYQDTLFRHLRDIFRDSIHHSCEIELLVKNGEKRIVLFQSVSQQESEKQLDESTVNTASHCLTVLTDITERRRQEEVIHHQANFDALTGLPNRYLLMDRISYTLRTAHRQTSGVSLFFIDLDNFKWINDTYGHAAGDAVLYETAQRLTECARENDTVARLSGDEFCMLLPNVHKHPDAEKVAKKVQESMLAPVTLENGQDIHVTCSIGISTYPADGETKDDLLKCADIALYQVKRNGRSQFAFYESKMDEETIQRLQLGMELKLPTIFDQLSLLYQPIFDLQSKKAIGAEALLRWYHPRLGLLLPVDFIPIAEENGAIIPIGEWVMDQIVKQVHQWNKLGIALGILWINISVKQCNNSNQRIHLTQLIENLKDWEGTPELGLEITESSVMEMSDTMCNAFEQLHRGGISLSVDDFGSGFSSLAQLLHLPVDIIKIDKSFIDYMLINEKGAKLVKAIIGLGHSMSTRIIAEGIENQEQLERLKQIKCDYGQGFHLSSPLGAEQFADFFKR